MHSLDYQLVLGGVIAVLFTMPITANNILPFFFFFFFSFSFALIQFDVKMHINFVPVFIFELLIYVELYHLSL